MQLLANIKIRDPSRNNKPVVYLVFFLSSTFIVTTVTFVFVYSLCLPHPVHGNRIGWLIRPQMWFIRRQQQHHKLALLTWFFRLCYDE